MMKSIFVIAIFGIAPLCGQTGRKILSGDDIQLIQLQDSIYVHVTWHESDRFGRFSSNGLIVIRHGQALMMDTPMDNDQTERLTKLVHDSLSADVRKLIIGHFHDDCLGGLGYLERIGVESLANAMTVEQCRTRGLPIPSIAFTDSLIFDFNGERIECRYVGPGHTEDNIVVWMPDQQVLFGGCLVKSAASTGLGNIADAVISDWDVTIKKIIKRYPGVKTVIPGHGRWGGSECLTHTIELVENERRK